MTTTIRDILQDLERVRENMLELSDDIWLSIDHNDPVALTEGVEFKTVYNDKMVEFDRLASDISELVQQYTSIRIGEPIQEPAHEEESEQQKNERVISDLDQEEAHNIDESFTYKRPYGFVLCGQGFKEVNTWRRMLEQVCYVLNQRGPELFSALPVNPDFISRRGNLSFASDPSQFRVASEVIPGMFVEVNLSANDMRNLICNLLTAFSLDKSDITIYLRQDRNA